MKKKVQNYIVQKILKVLDNELDKDKNTVSCWVLYQPEPPYNLDKYYEFKDFHDKKNITNFGRKRVNR